MGQVKATSQCVNDNGNDSQLQVDCRESPESAAQAYFPDGLKTVLDLRQWVTILEFKETGAEWQD